MQEIFSFVKNNWQLIVGVLTFIASVIVAIIRKRPVSSIYGEIYEICIFAINHAEETSFKGFDKLKSAISYATEKLRERYPNLDVNNYMTLIGLIIENILTTPQKKKER